MSTHAFLGIIILTMLIVIIVLVCHRSAAPVDQMKLESHKVRVLPEHVDWNDVSIVVPCVARHVKKLRSLLESIEHQWAKPFEVIIAISESEDPPRKMVQQCMPSVSCRYTCTPDKANAAMNRNRGTKMVSTPYVTFMDADDLMHPMYLSVLAAWTYQYPQSKVIYHAFSDQQVDQPHTCLIQRKSFIQRWNTNNTVGLDTDSFAKYTLHHGHVTLQTSIALKYPQNEEWKHSREEDSLWARTLLDAMKDENDLSLVFLDLPLSIYIPDERQYTVSQKIIPMTYDQSYGSVENDVP